MGDQNEFLVWLDEWIRSNFEDLPLPDVSGCSTYEKGVRKGMYEEKIFVGKTLRHRIDAEKKRIQEDLKWKKELEEGVD